MSSAAVTSSMLERRARWPVPVLLLLSIPVFYYNLGNYGLVNGDEGFFQRTALNMVRSGDWLTVQFNGELRVYETFLGSPIQVWARAALISSFGNNYWTMRLISATCGMLAVVFTYRLARQFMTSAESFLAAVLLMFSFQFVFLHGARTGEMEAILTFLFVWLAYSFVRALRENRSFIPHHLGLIGVICVKLPVIIIPVLFEAAYFALTPRYRKHIRRWALTLLWIGPLGMTWHIYQFIEIGPQKVFSVLGLMTEQASGVRGQAWANRGQTFWSGTMDRAVYYGQILLFGGFPYIILAPLALIGVWRHRASRRTTDFLKIITLIPLAVLFFYLVVARRQPWYMIPAYPFIAILVARFLFRLDRLGRGYVATALLGLTGALAVALTFRPAVPNPFVIHAKVIRPSSHLADLGDLAWWIYVPILAVTLVLAAMALRKLSHRLPVHALPALCILLVVGVGAVRIAGGLRFTDQHVSDTERFARGLARRMARGDPITFPVNVPPPRGRWPGSGIYTYHFEHLYKVSIQGRQVRLIRPLKPWEIPSLRREDLDYGLIPARGVLKRNDRKPRQRASADEDRPNRPPDRSAQGDVQPVPKVVLRRP